MAIIEKKIQKNGVDNAEAFLEEEKKKRDEQQNANL